MQYSTCSNNLGMRNICWLLRSSLSSLLHLPVSTKVGAREDLFSSTLKNCLLKWFSWLNSTERGDLVHSTVDWPSWWCIRLDYMWYTLLGLVNARKFLSVLVLFLIVFIGTFSESSFFICSLTVNLPISERHLEGIIQFCAGKVFLARLQLQIGAKTEESVWWRFAKKSHLEVFVSVSSTLFSFKT